METIAEKLARRRAQSVQLVQLVQIADVAVVEQPLGAQVIEQSAVVTEGFPAPVSLQAAEHGPLVAKAVTTPVAPPSTIPQALPQALPLSQTPAQPLGLMQTKAAKYDLRNPPPLAEIMRWHKTLEAVHADDNLWACIRIADRIALQRYYKLADQLAAQSPSVVVAGVPAIHIPDHVPVEKIEGLESADSMADKKKDTFSLDIVLNEKQQFALDLVDTGKCFVYTGSAGTGKTTGCRAIVKKYLNMGYQPSEIAVVSFTNRATGNIRNALFKDEILATTLSGRVLTIHKILEYKPIFYQHPTEDRTTMRFIPTRDASDPLEVKILIIEEASMLGLELWMKLYDAILSGIVIIFVGDINQLPPVMGKSIMNYALAKLPVVELTEVYRQALDSGIITNAHLVLQGKAPVKNKDTEIIEGKVGVITGQERMSLALGAWFNQMYDNGTYDPEQDIILSPWNKQPLGTINLNNWVAQHLGEKRNAMVYEILAGRRTLYLAIGDKVMVDKQDGIIVDIKHNGKYMGKSAQVAGTDMTRFGARKVQGGAAHEDIDNMITGYENINIDEVPDADEAKQAASHIVFVDLGDGITVECASRGDFAETTFSLGYALTVHKAQGCEWRKVFFILHHDHVRGGFLSRELVYTAITRAKEKLIIVAKPAVLQKAVTNQVIKGQTLQEKIAFITSGANNIGDYPVDKPGIWNADKLSARVRKEREDREKVAFVAKRKSIPFVDMEKYVPKHIIKQCYDNLDLFWARAKEIWGDTIGSVPMLTFDCQKATILGLANAGKHQIKLNPVLCILADGDPHWHKEMTEITLVHEVCHLVTAKYVNQIGHGKDWVMTMKLMKQVPDATYNGVMPNWKQTCKDILGSEDIDMVEGELEEGEQV